MKTHLNNEDLSEVCGVIATYLGLHFPRDRWHLLSRNLTLAASAFGFQHPGEFIHWIISSRLNKHQIAILASYLTITETFFWREPHVYSTLTNHVLPELVDLKKNGTKNIRIWSAGCSTGEEPYSLAIALQETIPDIKDWNITILATDINPKALSKAMKGVYTKWSFRGCPPWLRAKYFNLLGGENWQISPEIRDMVTFKNLNLTVEIFPSLNNTTNAMDIIFCRNVLMYFTDEWIRKISQNLFHSLNNDGWFVVSSCELSSQVFPQFYPVNFPGAILYRKSNEQLSSLKGGATYSDPPVHIPVKTPFPVSFDPLPPQSDPVISTNTPDRVEASEKEITFVGEIVHEVAHETEPFENIISKTKLMANQGFLNQALTLCNEGIAVDRLSIGLYLLRASVLQEQDKTCEAIASLKQVIYLDPNFIMAHFALGNLFVRLNKPKQARMYFNNVLDLIHTLKADDIVPESEGLSVKYIREIIMANMQKN